jgi:hypothetical protein
METVCVTAVLMGILLGVYWSARGLGFLLGTATLLRLDGLAASFATGGILLREPRRLLRIMMQAAIAIPWFVFAQIYFGSMMPHSAVAKALVPTPPAVNLYTWFAYFFLLPPGLWLSVPACAGLALLVRRQPRLGTWILIYIAAYVAGFTFSGVPMVNWYPIPVTVISVLLAVYGAVAFLTMLFARRHQAWAVAAAALLLLAPMPAAAPKVKFHLDDNDSRIGSYRAVGQYVNAVSTSPTTVYVGEVGMFGFEMLRHHVYDAVGLSSPEMDEIVRQVHETIQSSKELNYFQSDEQLKTVEVIKRMRPDWIAGRFVHLGMKWLCRERWFRDLYKGVKGPWDQYEFQTFLLKRESTPSDNR